ncbi:glycosyltransferase [Enterococcus sp. DIV0170]|uniref:glycosyltransferase n=1 Tax=Enterococcus sp. DIV0170 TaxID=2774642 RepID=UPI003F220CF0
MKKKVSVYTRDGHNASSSYYRVLQYTDELSKEEFFSIKERIFVPKFLTELQYNYGKKLMVIVAYHMFILLSSTLCFLADLIWKPDTLIILRSITPKTFFGISSFLYKKLVKKTKIVIWDFDDDIFSSNEISIRERNLLEQQSTFISVTHAYLSGLLNKKTQSKIILMPTTDKDFVKDKKDVITNRVKKYTTDINIVWVGSSASIDYLHLYVNGLNEAAKKLNAKGKNLNVIVVSNIPFVSKKNDFYLKNIKWTRDEAILAMESAHIGIMPLSNGIFEKGKGSFKLIQYMANSIPVIGSNVGFNSTVIKENFGVLTNDSDSKDLVNAILKIATDNELWMTMAENAHAEWKKNYSYENNLLKMKNMIQVGE